MLDLETEQPLTMAAATKLPQLARDGRRPHIATLFRWASQGVRGVKLETAQLAGSKVTTRQAVNRFLTALTNGSTDTSPATSETTQQRERRLAIVNRDLEQAGI